MSVTFQEVAGGVAAPAAVKEKKAPKEDKVANTSIIGQCTVDLLFLLHGMLCWIRP